MNNIYYGLLSVIAISTGLILASNKPKQEEPFDRDEIYKSLFGKKLASKNTPKTDIQDAHKSDSSKSDLIEYQFMTPTDYNDRVIINPQRMDHPIL